MKLAGNDFARLQASLLGALLLIAGSAAAAYLAYAAARDAGQELTLAQRERNESAGRWTRVHSEEAEIKEKSATFNSLQARGVIGEERRLEWVELLKEISERRHLLDLRYEFAAQQPLDGGGAGSGALGKGGYAFYASRMTLQLELLHEEDLTRLLGDLREKASALIQVRQCSVARLPHGGSGERQAQLHAECQIDWVTLRVAASDGSRR